MAFSSDVFNQYHQLAVHLSKIGDLDYKPLFFGLSININNVIVAMITYDNRVIIRSTPDTQDFIDETNLELHTYTKQGNPIRSGYYFVHPDLLNNHELLIEFFQKTYNGAIKVIDKQNAVKDTTLNKMPNIKVTLAKKLKDVGIDCPDALRRTGAPTAFALILRKHGDTLGNSILFKLEAAIRGIHEAALHPDDREKLNTELQIELQKLNIPDRFPQTIQPEQI